MDTSALALTVLATVLCVALTLLAGYALGRSRARSSTDYPQHLI